MAAGTTIQLKRKAGAFTGGQLAAGEAGVDTTNGDLYFSTTGSDAVQIDVSAIGGGGGGSGPTCQVLSADFSTTSTSFVDVDNGSGDDLIFSISANTTYWLEAFGEVSSAGVTDAVHLGINGPASPTTVSGITAYPSASTINMNVLTFTSYDESNATGNGPGAVANAGFYIRALIVNGSNSGNLAVRVASEVGNTTTIKQKSVAILTECA